MDAGSILAKLHLAGIQAVTYPDKDDFIVNTGIKNDDQKAKPDNPGKVEFDLTEGEYQIGFVTTLEYQAKSGNPQLLPEIQKYRKAFEKANPGKAAGIDKKIDQNAQKELEAEKKTFAEFLKKNAAALKKAGVKELDADKLDGQKLGEMSELVKKFTAGQKPGKAVTREQAAEKAKGIALEQIGKYIGVFSGNKDAEGKLDSQFSMVTVDPGVKNSNDSKLVSGNSIAFLKDNPQPKENGGEVSERVCFFIKYSIVI